MPTNNLQINNDINLYWGNEMSVFIDNIEMVIHFANGTLAINDMLEH